MSIQGEKKTRMDFLNWTRRDEIFICTLKCPAPVWSDCMDYPDIMVPRETTRGAKDSKKHRGGRKGHRERERERERGMGWEGMGKNHQKKKDLRQKKKPISNLSMLIQNDVCVIFVVCLHWEWRSCTFPSFCLWASRFLPETTHTTGLVCIAWRSITYHFCSNLYCTDHQQGI